LYGQREITVAGDHKPLEAIFKKPSIKHPSSAKDDSRDKAVCSHCQVQTRQASGPSRCTLQSLLSYRKCTPM